MTPRKIKLHWSQFELAAHVACKRRLLAMRYDRSRPHGYCDDMSIWDFEINAAAAEFAASLALNESWHMTAVPGPMPPIKPPDVGSDVEVRWTQYSTGCLLLYDNDVPERFFILVTGWAPNFKVVGGIRGEDGMQEAFETVMPLTGTRGWKVEQKHLIPFSLLEQDKEAA